LNKKTPLITPIKAAEERVCWCMGKRAREREKAREREREREGERERERDATIISNNM
jgi:hypothetical protein